MYSAKMTKKRGLKNVYQVKLKIKENRIIFYIDGRYSGYYLISGGAIIVDAFDEVRHKLFSDSLEKMIKASKSEVTITEFLAKVGFSTLKSLNKL